MQQLERIEEGEKKSAMRAAHGIALGSVAIVYQRH
jgi:hypothetical protein